MPATFISLIRKNRHAFFLAAAAFMLFLVIAAGIEKRDLFYPDETRIVYIARHISLADPLIIKFGPHRYYQKPPLYFWIISPLARLKVNVAKVSLVFLNIILAFVLASINTFFLKKEGSPAAALSFWLVVTSVVYFAMSVVIRMDMLYTLFLSLSIIIFYRAYQKNKNIFFVLSGFFSFLACFTKGGFGFFIPFLTTLLFSLRQRKPFLWRGFFISWISASIFILVWLLGFNLVDSKYLHHMLFEQTFRRAFSPFAHVQSFSYYFLFFWVGFFPWSIFLVPLFFRLSRKKLTDWQIFYLCWLGGGMLVLTLTQSKNIMYLLPLSIPVASLAAEELRCKRKAGRLMLYILSVVMIALLLAAGVLFRKKINSWFLLLPVALMFSFLYLSVFRQKNKVFNYFFAGWSFLLILGLIFIMPPVSKRRGLRQIAEFIKTDSPEAAALCVMQDNLLALSLYLSRPSVLVDNRDFSSCPHPFLLVGRRKNALPFLPIKKSNKFILYYVK